MRKVEKDFMNKVTLYNNYASEHNCYIPPVTGTNSGNAGRAYEMVIKLMLGNYRGALVSASGRKDTIKKVDGKMQSIEIKQGCGEIGILNSEGNFTSCITQKELVIYSKGYDPVAVNSLLKESDGDVKEAFITAYRNGYIEKSYVLRSEVFYSILNECGLLRYKNSSSMTKKPVTEQYPDRVTIQSFKNSKCKNANFTELLEMNGEDLLEWLGL